MYEVDKAESYTEMEQKCHAAHANFDRKRREGIFRSRLLTPLIAVGLASFTIGFARDRAEVIEVGGGTLLTAAAIDAQACLQRRWGRIGAVQVALVQNGLARGHNTWTPVWANQELRAAAHSDIEKATQRINKRTSIHADGLLNPPSELEENQN
jgi:hypothetical protein